jgi:RimJ/RimL family protein N-acetyltransferase
MSDIFLEKIEQEIGPEELRTLTRWENDPELVGLMRPCQYQEVQNQRRGGGNWQVKTESYVREMYTELTGGYNRYLIYLKGQGDSQKILLGETSYTFSFPTLYENVPNTAWTSLFIGEKEMRGRGYARAAFMQLEDLCCQRGCERFELGVFAFNGDAQKFYQKMGYREIGRIPRFTYWKGQWWEDIRMEKKV